NRDAAGGLGKHTFRFGEQLNAGNDFFIGAVFRPATGLRNEARSEVAVRGVPNRQRLRNRIRFHGADLTATALDGIRDRIATRGLGAVKACARPFADPAETLKFLETLMNFADHRATRHRNYDRVGSPPSKLFSNLIGDCLGTLGIERTKIHVYKSPGISIDDLAAQTVDRVVVAFYCDETRAVDLSRENFALFQIVGNQDE